jgi:enamine deaminase RidA (YjgF/YER057c/UK114 family)
MQPTPIRQRIKAPNIPEHKNPFPAAVRIDNVLFSSAIGGEDPETHTLPPDKSTQIKNAFQNIRNILAAAGASPANIGKVTIYVADRADRELVNPHWLEMFPDEDDRPVRHTAATSLPPGRHIQIEFIAVLP